MTDRTLTSNRNNDPLLIKALRELLDRYVGLVNSGDAGNWDPEKEGEVAQARAALRIANVAPYMNSPIECGHRLARLVCPDCGIDLRGNVLNTSETLSSPEAIATAHERTPAAEKEIIPLGCSKCSNVVIMPAANGVCDIRKAEGWVWSIVEGWRCPAHAQKALDQRAKAEREVFDIVHRGGLSESEGEQ